MAPRTRRATRKWRLCVSIAFRLRGHVALGYEIVGIPEGQALGAVEIQSRAQALEVCRALRGLCARYGARAVFGVFPTDILSVAYGNPGVIRLFAAANSRRSQEGGPVTFCHREWLQVGRLAARAVLR